MKKPMKLMTLMMGLAIGSFIACSDDGGDDDPANNNNNGGGGATVNKYAGSASYGDLVTFEIDKTNQGYTLSNETTSQTETGNYDVLDANAYGGSGLFEGIYQVVANNDTFFAVELDDKIIAANFPSGNPSNDISFGVSSEISNVGKESQIAGSYFYVRLGPYLTQGEDVEWGVFTADSDSLHGTAVQGKAPADTSFYIPLSSLNNDSSDTGFDYGFNITNDAINVTYGPASFEGYAYVDNITSVFLIDLGTGNGSVFAYKMDESWIDNGPDYASVVGDYKYIDFYADGDKGAGNFRVNADGTMDASWTDGSEVEVGSTQGQSLVYTGFPNLFSLIDYDGSSDLYFIFTGEAVMYFEFDGNGMFEGYGTGAKLN